MAEGKDTHPAEQEVSSKRPPWWSIAITGLSLVGMAVVIVHGYLARPGWVGVADKKFWDYLELLIVPAALALGVYWLNRAQSEREREAEETQQKHERVAEEARREREREAQAAQRERELEVENQRAQDAALQAYLDQMSLLLTDRARPLHRAQLGDSLSTVARARTLTVLRRLEGEPKGSIVQFLYESGLIIKSRPVLSIKGADLMKAHLGGADLRGADLRGAYLVGANLSKTNLSGADLREAYLIEAQLRKTSLSAADLRGAYLRGVNLTTIDLSAADLTGADARGADLSAAHLSNTNLRKADLREADLSAAHLSYANLREADLRDANLSGVLLNGACLRGANLSGAHLGGHELVEFWASRPEIDRPPWWIRPAKWGGAILRGADLRDAYLVGTNLSKTNLSGANLSEANLHEADLSGADLSNAIGVTNEQLEQQAWSLEGATMPNGQRYEDRLKSKGSGEHGENSGAS